MRNINNKKNRIITNSNIRASEVRVIGPDGTQFGILSLNDAIKKAEEYDMDLVQVSNSGDKVVCKIIESGKYLYLQNKSKKEQKPNPSSVTKQMKFRPQIDEHDYITKLNHVRDFISKGMKVKITIMFRGREAKFIDKGYTLIEKISKDLFDIGEMIGQPVLDGRDLRVTFKVKNI